MEEEDSLARREELAALEEIYGDELCVERGEQGPGAEGWRGYFSVGPVQLHVKLPSSYPSQSAPHFEIKHAPEELDLSDVASQLSLLFIPGEIVLFAWVECLRELVNALPESFGKSEAGEDNPKSEERGELGEDDVAVEQHEDLSEASPIKIVSGDPQTIKKSTFQAHVANVSEAHQVVEVLRKLKSDKKIAKATHNIMAFRIEREAGAFIADNDDDGESAAGGRLAHLLELVHAKNVVVVVSRWYGGVQLGPSRFKIINNVARDLLQKEGFINV